MRGVAVLMHRWVGLAIAAILVVLGLTGAVIAWDEAVDEWLNPQLFRAGAAGPARPALELATGVEARDGRVRVISLPLAAEPGGTLRIGVEPRLDPAAGRPFRLDYTEVFVDPASGAEAGRREWGRAWPISRETAVSFLYKLHYSLHIPPFWGVSSWGEWLTGGAALLWALDCFVGAYLTFPPRRRTGPGWSARWRPAWLIKARGSSAFRVTFDLHRAAGLWSWGVLFVLAFTGFSLNLYREVFFPALAAVSTVTPQPADVRLMHGPDNPAAPAVGLPAIVAAATRDGAARGFADPVGRIYYDSRFDYYFAQFYRPGEEDAAAGVGPPLLYYDGATGEALGARLPWTGTAADLFIQAQFPLHSGRIAGVAGRVLVSAAGLATAALSVTGVVIWWRKRRARTASARRRRDAQALAAPVPGGPG